MAISASPPFRLDGYQLRLSSFEGPLDVLLRLIEREQLPIDEVSLVVVLDQFMDYMAALGDLSPDVIAEFAAVACRLSVLKSRALLPRPTIERDAPDGSELVRQLEEYRAIKAAAAHLAERKQSGVGAFRPGVGINVPSPEPPRLRPEPPSTLSRAVIRWLTRLPPSPIPLSPRRSVSLREMVSRLFRAFTSEPQLEFDKFRLAECQGKHETAVAFLALLTLVRRRLLDARQATLFGPITVTRLNPRQHPDVMESDDGYGAEKLFA